MQTIRLSRGNKPRTIHEKIIEMVLALRLELRFSKKEILSLYSSYAPFGGNVVGLEAASWRYFGCEPHKLTWAECAMLAVLPNSPSLIHPGKNRDILLQKRNRLLQRLFTGGIIDSVTCELSKLEQLPPKPFALPQTAPHLLHRAEKEYLRKNSKKRNQSRESKISTTIDAAIQQRVVQIINRHHLKLSGNGVYNAAALVLENKTGKVICYVGNVQNQQINKHGFSVDIITAPRSTGSILKPILYSAMLESGELIPTQLIQDLPLRIGGFAPQNFNRSFEGAVAAHSALSRSLNVPAVSLLHSYGIDRFYSFLKGIGMTTLHRKAEDYGLTLILGGAEGTLWDITGIYSGMARTLLDYAKPDSCKHSPFFLPYYMKDDSLSTSKTNNPNKNYLSAASVWLTFDAMEDVIRPEEESTWEQFTSSKRIAWKTGTSFGFRDAWAVGVTPEHTIGVWVGNADGEGRPNLTGISSAAPILFDIYTIFDKKGWFSCPEADLIDVEICTKSGYKAGINCNERKFQKSTIAGTEGTTCPYCQIIHCDSTLSYRVHSECEQVYKIVPVSCFVLPPAMELFYRKRHFEYRPLPPLRADCQETSQGHGEQVLTIIFPRPNSKIYIPIELNGKRGKTVFEAAHRRSGTVIYWHIDDEYIGSTRDIHQISCSASAGVHMLTLVDENGESIQREFEILAK